MAPVILMVVVEHHAVAAAPVQCNLVYSNTKHNSATSLCY